MHYRSPAVFWLLAAATLAADGVAISWFYASTLNRAGDLYFALICSQISAVCIGAFFSSIRHRWWMSPLAASMSAALITTSILHFGHDLEDAYQQILLYL